MCSSLFERKPEDLTTAHAILDLSTSHLNLPPPPPLISAPGINSTKNHPPPQQSQPQPPPPLIPALTPTSKSSSSPNHNNNNSSSEQNLNFPLTTVDTNKQGKGTGGKGNKTKQTGEKKKSAKKEGGKGAAVTTPTPGATSTPTTTKTIAYTYEAFFISDGRSKKKQQQNTASLTSSSPKENNIACLPAPSPVGSVSAITTPTSAKFDPSLCCSDSEGDTLSLSSGLSGGLNSSPGGDGEIGPLCSKEKSRYTCSECGKNYATSSNLSRHKQTHRSLDSQAAKR